MPPRRLVDIVEGAGMWGAQYRRATPARIANLYATDLLEVLRGLGEDFSTRLPSGAALIRLRDGYLAYIRPEGGRWTVYWTPM